MANLDFAAIGQTLKQQYPQYAKYDDNTLGQLYIKKYRPADYQSALQEQSANTSLGQSVAQAQAKRAIDYSPEAIQQEVNKKTALAEADAKVKANIEKNKPKTLTEGEKTKHGLAISGLKSLKKAVDEYQKDPEVLNKQLIPGKFLSRAYDANAFAAVDPILRIRTGAQAPDTEKRNYMSAYIGKYGDSPEVVNSKVQSLKQAYIDEGFLTKEEADKIFPFQGIKVKSKQIQQQIQPQQTQQFQGKNPLNQILSKAGEYAGQAPLVPGSPLNIKDALAVIQSPIGRAINQRTNSVIDTLQAGKLPSADQTVGAGGELALGASTLVGGGILPSILAASAGGATYGATTPGATMEQRAKDAGVGALLAASTLGIAKGAPKVLRPFKTVGENRAAKIAQAAGVEIDPQAMIRAAEKKLPTISPTERTYFIKELDNAKKIYGNGQKLTVEEAVQLNKHLNDAYTASGQVGKSGKAAFEKITGDALKREIATNAPDVAKANKYFSSLYNTQKKTKNITKVGGGIALGAIISKLLYGH